MQIKNNQVKFGVNVKPTFANPSFRTQTTTPMSQVGPAQGMTFPSMGALGITPKLSKSPTPLVPGTNNYTPMGIQALGGNRQPSISTSTPQTGQTAGPTVNSAQNSVASGSQGALSTTQTTGVNSRGGIDRPSTRPEGFFPGVLNDLLGASKATKEQERARKEMERIAAGNKQIGDNAAAISKQYGDEIARVGGIGAGQLGQLGRGTTNVAYGNAMTAQNMASARMDALAKGQQAALEGTAQQLTGQEQQANAFNPSLQASLVQQQQGITGLSNAANYAQPTQVPYSNQFIDPVTGQSAGGAGLGGYAGYNAAQQAIELTGQYPDAGVQYDPNLSPEQNLQRIQQAIQGSPNYQKNTYGVPGQQSFADATVQQTAQKGYQDSYQMYQEIDKQKSYADERTDSLLNVMSQYGINENDVRKGNEIENYLRRQFGEEGVIAYQTALAEAQRAYSSLLTIGGGTIPTEATAASNIILSSNSTPKQAMAAIKQLKAAGEQRLRTQGSQANAYYQQLQQGSQQSGGGSIGGTGGGTGWDNILD